MPYNKINKEDLWGVIADAPAPDEEVGNSEKEAILKGIEQGLKIKMEEAVEVQVNPDGTVEAAPLTFKANFAQEMAIDFATVEKVVIEEGINNLTYPVGVAKQFVEKLEEEDPPTQRRSEMLVWYPRNADIEAGYADHTAALDPIPHFNITDLLARFFIQSHAQWGVIKNWRLNIIGCTSNCYMRGMGFQPLHMPVFDYDGKNVKKIIRKDVKTLQKDFGLGNAWVYETRRGFHVYFFCDTVSWDDYRQMLDQSQCCKGFKRASMNRGYAVLRVSAKYTDFDIKPLYMLPNEAAGLQRLPRKAHTIQALLKLGEECGTHFASMYPQWAHFKQDYKEWRPNTKKPTAKRIKKGAKFTYNKQQPSGFYTGSTSTASATITVNNPSNTWVTTGGNGTGNY